MYLQSCGTFEHGLHVSPELSEKHALSCKLLNLRAIVTTTTDFYLNVRRKSVVSVLLINNFADQEQEYRHYSAYLIVIHELH